MKTGKLDMKRGVENMRALKTRIWNKSDIYFLRIEAVIIAITAAAYLIRMF